MKRLLLIAALFTCSLFTYAQLLGSGTEDDPYMIYDADDLNEVRDYVGVEGIYFQLANDIDLSAYSEGEGWEPIGTIGAQFKGVFDGNGYTITNLKINRTTDYMGLFGYATSTIKRIHVECDIKGKGYVGGICGYGSTFTDCRVSGTITGTGNYIGGICGYGDLSKCKANVDVTGVGYVGGISGKSESINTCMVEGTITNTGDYSGGITGYLNSSCSIYDCIIIGSVDGQSYTGGICGYAPSSTYIRSCFTNISIHGKSFVGGVCGQTYGFSSSYYSDVPNYYSDLENCVAVNTYLSAKDIYGRIVGKLSSTDYPYTYHVRNNLSLSTTKIIVNDSETTVSDDVKNGTGIGNALLKRKSTYTDLGWDFDEVWNIDEGTSYPYLRYFNPTETQSIAFETPSLSYGDREYTLPETTEQGLTIKWTCSDENKLSVTGNKATIKGTGECYLIAEQSGDNIYKSIQETYPITITKAQLTITADNFTRNIGEVNPELTVTYSGFVYNEDETALTTPPAITTEATINSPAGVYAITVSGAQSDNYDISYMNGTLTIIDEATLRNTITITQTLLRTGNNANLSVSLDNEDTMIAFEFYMQLPEGISIALDEDGYPDVILNSARSNRHVLEVSQNSAGLYHFLCYSNSNNALKGNSGELLSINIVCDEDVNPEIYQGHIRNIKFSDNNENRIILPNLDFDLEVSNVLMGDVNDDGDIDVMDVVMMVNYMMERPSASFIFAAADHTGDGIVDVMDLVREVSLVMSQQASGAPVSQSYDALGGGLSLVVNSDGLVNVHLADGKQYVASQFIVALSEGQILSDVTSDRSHHVSIQPLPDNRYFVMSYSMSNETFAVNDQTVTLHVVGQGTVSVEDVAFVDTNDNKVAFQNASTETTGITKTTMDFATPADIYSVDGVLIKKGVITKENIHNGLYIINGKKIVVK